MEKFEEEGIFFFKIYRTITDHSGRLHYELGGEGAKVNRWSECRMKVASIYAEHEVWATRGEGEK